MSGHNTERYYALIEALVVDQQEVWGDQAVEIADSVSGLYVTDEDIWVNGDGRVIAGELAAAYIDRFGQAAESSLQAVASDFEDLRLPAELED